MTSFERHDGRPDEQRPLHKPAAVPEQVSGSIPVAGVRPRILARLPNLDTYDLDRIIDSGVTRRKRMQQRISTGILVGGMVLLVIVAILPTSKKKTVGPTDTTSFQPAAPAPTAPEAPRWKSDVTESDASATAPSKNSSQTAAAPVTVPAVPASIPASTPALPSTSPALPSTPIAMPPAAQTASPGEGAPIPAMPATSATGGIPSLPTTINVPNGSISIPAASVTNGNELPPSRRSTPEYVARHRAMGLYGSSQASASQAVSGSPLTGDIPAAQPYTAIRQNSSYAPPAAGVSSASGYTPSRQYPTTASYAQSYAAPAQTPPASQYSQAGSYNSSAYPATSQYPQTRQSAPAGSYRQTTQYQPVGPYPQTTQYQPNTPYPQTNSYAPYPSTAQTAGVNSATATSNQPILNARAYPDTRSYSPPDQRYAVPGATQTNYGQPYQNTGYGAYRSAAPVTAGTAATSVRTEASQTYPTQGQSYDYSGSSLR